MIKAVNLSKTYKMGEKKVEAVRKANFEVDKGEFFVIEGVSGSGKTTLLYLLGGLDRPSEGTVEIDGQDITRLSENQLAKFRLKNIGFVFQTFNLIPTLNARENVEAAIVPTGMPAAERIERAMNLLKAVGMENRWHHLPGKLSGGEQQRVAIARALANNPKVVLADEPTGDLDTKTGLKIIEMLKELSLNNGQTVIVVTHAPYVAEYATRRAKMEDGVLTFAD
ncbi:MAG: putative transport system ATP-binding protein [Eubacteriales bacterium]|nr:putative transport system ATP-binding protein [Eubacteriales bacterium]MDN5363900.1 putative transport system ATP-binding protein [Eubacteriales bacterium]